jgi:uncharacterized protein (TIRG00374 family)
VNGHRGAGVARRWSRRLRGVAALGLAPAVLWWGLPRVAGASWATIGAILGDLSIRVAVGLAALWACGLVAHSFVLTAALPGLNRGRALTLSLTGSAVSNIVPFGGALGLALNLSMVRAWRFHKGAYATYVIVTNAWDVLAKLALPLVAVVLMTGAGVLPGSTLQSWAIAGSAVVLALVALGGVALRSNRLAAHTARLVAELTRRLTRRHPLESRRVQRDLMEARERVRGIVAARWPQLTSGMAAYMALQAALLGGCLLAFGLRLPLYAVIAALAADRVLSLIPLTPGGAGFTEVGTAAALIGFGADPVRVAAAVLLYRAFTFLLEIPVGGVWLGVWLARRPRPEGATA